MLAQASRLCDPLDVRVMAERWLVSDSQDDEKVLVDAMTQHPATAVETAGEYLDADLCYDGMRILSLIAPLAKDVETNSHGPSSPSPMIPYYLALLFSHAGGLHGAWVDHLYKVAGRMPHDYCFPFQPEAIDVLRAAMKANPRDARHPTTWAICCTTGNRMRR